MRWFVLISILGCGPRKAPVPAPVEQAVTESSSVHDFDRLWNFKDPAGTRAAFEGLLDEARAIGPDLELQIQTQIARCQGLERDFDQAHATLDQVESRVGEAGPLVRVRLLLERGRVHRSSGDKAASHQPFLDAFELAQAEGHAYYAVDAAHMLGIVEEPDAALAWNARAIELAEASGDERTGKWLGALYNNTGWTWHDKGEFDKALDLFEKGLAFREAQGKPVPTRIAKWSVARTHRSMGHLDLALEMQQALLQEWTEAGDQSGYVHEELGECLLALGREDEAAPHFRQAWELLGTDPWLKENEPDRLARLAELGQVQAE